MSDLVIDAQAIAVIGGVRPRAGAVPNDAGVFADEDQEVVISFQMGCHRNVALLGPDGKGRGQMVPIGEISRPLSEYKRVAELLLGGTERREEAAEAARV